MAPKDTPGATKDWTGDALTKKDMQEKDIVVIPKKENSTPNQQTLDSGKSIKERYAPWDFDGRFNWSGEWNWNGTWYNCINNWPAIQSLTCVIGMSGIMRYTTGTESGIGKSPPRLWVRLC